MSVASLSSIIKALDSSEIASLLTNAEALGALGPAALILGLGLYNFEEVKEELRREQIRRERARRLGAAAEAGAVLGGGASIAAAAIEAARKAAEGGGGGGGGSGAGAGAGRGGGGGAGDAGEAGEEQKDEPEEEKRRRSKRIKGNIKTGVVTVKTKFGRKQIIKFIADYLEEEVGARPDLITNSNILSFINYLERHGRTQGQNRNINFFRFTKKGNFSSLIPSANIGSLIAEWFNRITGYFNRFVIPGFGGLRFPQIAQNWWESLEDGKKLVAGPDGMDRTIEGGDLVERIGDLDLGDSRPGDAGVFSPGFKPPDPSTVRPGPGLSAGDLADAGLGAGLGAGSGAGKVGGGEAGSHPGAGSDANPDPNRIIMEIQEILDRPNENSRPPDPYNMAEEELKDASDSDVLDAANEVGFENVELEPLIRRGVDQGQERNLAQRARDFFNRNWGDLPDPIRNRIVNAWQRWGGQNRNTRRLIGIIGAMIIGGLILRLPRVGSGPDGPPVGPEPPVPPVPPGPPVPGPDDKDKCCCCCEKDENGQCTCGGTDVIPPDDDETPVGPEVPDVPGEHGEHPTEMQLGDTFGLSPASYLNSNDVNRPSLFPAQQGLSFDTGEYDMSNALIRGNMMNDAIRYGGKLFMPEMPLPPPRKLTRGYINARAPENMNELVTQKPQLNTGAVLHQPFNRAFQEFDVDTGAVVNNYMKSQIARLSFGC